LICKINEMKRKRKINNNLAVVASQVLERQFMTRDGLSPALRN